MNINRLSFLKTIGVEAIISQTNLIFAKNIFAKTSLNLGLASYTLREAEDGSSVEIGRGVINIPAILKALQKINYKGVMAIEYEKDGKTAILGLSESVGYVRGIMKMV